LRRLVDRAVRLEHLLAHQAHRDRLVGARIYLIRRCRREDLAHLANDHRGRHAARHLARVVAAHAVGEHGEAVDGIRSDGVFVMRAHHPRVRAARDLEYLGEIHAS
jgi:hypothetical protein